jgi:hypothetical protein
MSGCNCEDFCNHFPCPFDSVEDIDWEGRAKKAEKILELYSAVGTERGLLRQACDLLQKYHAGYVSKDEAPALIDTINKALSFEPAVFGVDEVEAMFKKLNDSLTSCLAELKGV